MSSPDVPLVAVIPFVLLLGAIAVFPLVAPGWWDDNRHKGILAGALSLPVIGWILSADPHLLLHTGHEYVSFIALLGALFTISGGIFVDGDLRATPWVNAAFLVVGAVLANVVGTTGASMLLIRPLLHTNRERAHTVHTFVFFIFVVSNAGGLLTPLGDPPLFMGYLRGVPFTWTFGLWPVWLGVVTTLVSIYVVWDHLAVRRESATALLRDESQIQPLSVQGGWNFALLAGVVLTVALVTHAVLRDVTLVALAVASLRFTPATVRERNHFHWHPIIEVAVLFAGIFTTMVPALVYLEHHGSALGLDSPVAFFWTTGLLSSFLDNAPTYLTFTSTAAGMLGATDPAITADNLGSLVGTGAGEAYLRAISIAAVLFGANTYIGNGPNFMVKAMVESAGVKMPGFFGYMGYAACVLLPIWLVVSLVAI